MSKIKLEKFKVNLVKEIEKRIQNKYAHRAQRQLDNPHFTDYYFDNNAVAVINTTANENAANAYAAAAVHNDSGKDNDYKAKLVDGIGKGVKGSINYFYSKFQFRLQLKHQQPAEKIMAYFSSEDGSINEQLIRKVVDQVVDRRSAAISNVEDTQPNKNKLYDYLARYVLKVVKNAGDADIEEHDANEVASHIGEIPSKKAKKEILTTVNGAKYTTEGLLFFKKPKYTNPIPAQAENHAPVPGKP